MRKRVLLIGPFPPPAGGVSIHLQRLTRLLREEFDFDFIDESRIIKEEYFNLRNYKFSGYFKKIYKTHIVYIHSGPGILKIFHIITGKLFHKKVILTIHAYPSQKAFPIRMLDQFFFRLADTVIAVNSEIRERVTIPAQKFIVMNAFLPPLMDEEPELPHHILEWILTRKNEGKRIICSNAYRLELFNDQDLYGLDLCIEAAKRLIRDQEKVCFIFNVSVLDGYATLFDRYLQCLIEENLKYNFLLINLNLSFVKLAEQADIILRLTNTDGDALTVREALFLGKTVIASDVVKRPAGTTLFRSRDLKDLIVKLKESLNKKPAESLLNTNEEITFFKEYYADLLYKLTTDKKS